MQHGNMKMARIADLKFASYNPRKMPKTERQKLKNSLKEFGCVRPLIINKRTGILVSGHQTATVAKEDLGWEELPYLEVDVDEDREKILNIKNRK